MTEILLLLRLFLARPPLDKVLELRLSVLVVRGRDCRGSSILPLSPLPSDSARLLLLRVELLLPDVRTSDRLGILLDIGGSSIDFFDEEVSSIAENMLVLVGRRLEDALMGGLLVGGRVPTASGWLVLVGRKSPSLRSDS